MTKDTLIFTVFPSFFEKKNSVRPLTHTVLWVLSISSKIEVESNVRLQTTLDPE